MTYKEKLLGALAVRRDIYEKSNSDRILYMAQGIEAAETIARSIPDDVIEEAPEENAPLTFTVIDPKTGRYPNLWRIAKCEEWASQLVHCSMSGFILREDGRLALMDELGSIAYCPDGRFEIVKGDSGNES